MHVQYCRPLKIYVHTVARIILDCGTKSENFNQFNIYWNEKFVISLEMTTHNIYTVSIYHNIHSERIEVRQFEE